MDQQMESLEGVLEAPVSSSSSAAVTGPDGAMYLRWEPGMTTTTTTHITQTVTHFPPVRLPLPSSSRPLATSLPLPHHLSPARFPLATTPTPEDLRFFALDLHGRKVIFREEGTTDEEERAAERASREGRGWVRCGEYEDSWGGGSNVKRERLGVVEALSTGMDPRRKGKAREQTKLIGAPPALPAGLVPSTTTSFPGVGRTETYTSQSQSPPRKRLRDTNFAALSSPHLSSSRSGGQQPAVFSPPDGGSGESDSDAHAHDPHQPSVGSGVELSVLYSLPSLLSEFDQLPPKLKEHFLMHCFRRSELSTIQRLSSFISPALKFDFVTRFPPEIAITIFTFVERSGLAAAARVSRKWNEMVDGQRGIWAGRLIADGLWWGFGAEEEEEEKVRRRWEMRDLLDAKGGSGKPSGFYRNTLGTPTDTYLPDPWSKEGDGGGGRGGGSRGGETSTSSPDGPSLPPTKRRSHPLKQVYRMRHMQVQNWSKSKPAGQMTFHGHGNHVVTCLQFDMDKIVSASDDHSINIYGIKEGTQRYRFDGHEGGVWALQYKGDVLVSGSTDRTVRVWSIEKRIQTHVFHGHTSTVRCLQIVDPVRQPNGEFLPPYPLIVTGSRDSTVRVWRLPGRGEPDFKSPVHSKHHYGSKRDAEPVPPSANPFHNHCLEGHTNAVRAITAHGKYCVTGSYDCTVRVWDIVKGVCLHVLRGHQQKVYSVVLDARRNRIASGSADGTVKVWDLIHGTCLATLEGHASLVGLLGASPNYLVSAAADSTIKVWDANGLTCKQTLSAHAGAITCFQHDETKIVSGSEGTLKMWDIRDGSFVRDLVTGVQGVWQVQFSGRYLVSASNKVGLTVFDVIDFGDCGYDDGAGDESLDELITPEWERQNRLEPRTYQDVDPPRSNAATTSTTTTNTGGSSSSGGRSGGASMATTRAASEYLPPDGGPSTPVRPSSSSSMMAVHGGAGNGNGGQVHQHHIHRPHPPQQGQGQCPFPAQRDRSQHQRSHSGGGASSSLGGGAFSTLSSRRQSSGTAPPPPSGSLDGDARVQKHLASNNITKRWNSTFAAAGEADQAISEDDQLNTAESVEAAEAAEAAAAAEQPMSRTIRRTATASRTTEPRGWRHEEVEESRMTVDGEEEDKVGMDGDEDGEEEYMAP